MKSIKTTLSLLLLLSLLITALASCGGGNNGTGENGDGNGDENISTPTYDISNYSIIRSDVHNYSVIRMVSILKTSILENAKVDLPVAIDVDVNNEYEILIGDTTREESITALNELKSKTSKEAFIIKVLDKKIVIVGISEEDTMIAVKHFINEFVDNVAKDGCLPLKSGDMLAQKTGKVIAHTDKNAIIVLEQSTDIFKPANGMEKTNCTYGKIIKLEHSGENNGVLLATHETVTGEPYPLFRSDDDGKTWTKITDIKDSVNPGAVLGYQPYLYELPEAVGAYPAGTLFFASCSRVGSKQNTYMVLQVSTDLGVTWMPIGNVDMGGSYNDGNWSSDGLWEPVLMYEAETKRLYCFYSDELINGEGDSHVGGHNQRLVYKYTTDLVTWSDKYEMVACENANARPGMVALTRLGDGRYALAYEMVSNPNGPNAQIYIKYANTLDGWDPADIGKPVVTANGASLGSAPALAWTPDGGECGTLLLVAHGSWGDGTGNKCALFISSDYGETWKAIKNPIDVYPNPDLRSGYSPGFFVDKEGVIYYVNNPAAFPVNEKLSFARIRIY